MRRLLLTLAAVLAAAPAYAAPAGTIVAGEDLCQLNRGQDQLKLAPGTAVQEGDLVKCIGKTKAKAFFGDVLVLFGPLSETQIVSARPLVLQLNKGALRAMSAPGSGARFTVRTPKTAVSGAGADAFVRYNAASEFTEVLAVEGRLHAENTGVGAAGAVDLNPLETSLLSPESAPTQPSPIGAGDVRGYTRDTDLAMAPLPGGDVFRGLEATTDRIEAAYNEARRTFAEPSLPAGAPFRSLDARRQAFAAPQFDQPGLEVAPGGAAVTIDYDFSAPQLRPE